MNENRVIYHVDVNSAFLSWTAAYRVNVLGDGVDLRTVPSVIGGDEELRHGIVLAKSIPAKKCGIKTGEALMGARSKCPGLIVAPADYGLYVQASRALIALLREVSPVVEQYSIDEAYCDMTGVAAIHGDPVSFAERLKTRIRVELGFTVNIGVSSNKLLAKMAGGFEKPDRVHTLFPDEIREKLWPLPAGDLFFVGRATEKSLRAFSVTTIGQLAQTDPDLLRRRLHKHGEAIWNYANGRCCDEVTDEAYLNKGYGNSTTTPFDLTDSVTAKKVLLSLCETVGTRMRRDGQTGRTITVHYRSRYYDRTCRGCSKQTRMPAYTNVTEELYRSAGVLFDRLWDGQTPIRQLGVHVTGVSREGCRQYNLFDGNRYARMEALDETVDNIRDKFGEHAIFRARFLDGTFSHMGGGLHPDRRTGVIKPV